MASRVLLVLLVVLFAVQPQAAVETPEREPAATGPADTGAFEEEEPLSGKIRADGSSTVGPLVTLAPSGSSRRNRTCG